MQYYNKLMLKLKKPIAQLQHQDYVIRYQGRVTIHQQTIAEHMAHTAQYVMLLCTVFDVPEQDKLLAIQRAVVHDLPETETADVPFTTHRDFVDFARAYDKVETRVWSDKFPELNVYVEKFTNVWYLVKLADKLDVVAYIEREQQLGNNTEYLQNALLEECVDINKIIEKLEECYGCKHN